MKLWWDYKNRARVFLFLSDTEMCRKRKMVAMILSARNKAVLYRVAYNIQQL
jgi:hypothetical protein